VFTLGKPTLMFAGKARHYLIVAPLKCSTLGHAPGLLLTYIRLVWKANQGQTLQLILKICQLWPSNVL